MKKTILILLALLIMSTANAQILTTGSVNIRSGPGLDYDAIGSIDTGKVLLYLYETEVDDRGVEWYHIGYKEMEGWVSSKYARNLEGPVEEVSVREISRYIEAADWYDKDLAKAAKKLNLNYKYVIESSEAPVRYYNEALMVAGYEDISCMILIGPGYTIYGAAVGMKLEDARAKLEEAGMVFHWERENCVSYERPTPEDSKMDWAEHDSILYVDHENGIVYSLNWQGYTG